VLLDPGEWEVVLPCAKVCRLVLVFRRLSDYLRLAKRIARLRAKSELQFSLQAGFARVMHRLPDAGAKPATCLWAGNVHHPELELLE